MRRAIVLLVVIAVIAAAIPIGLWLPLQRARDDWRRGRVGDAIERAEWWSRFGAWDSQYAQVLAAARLSVGDRAGAQRSLDQLRKDRVWFPIMPKEEVARRLFARGAYGDFLAYDSASRERSERNSVALYRAAALAATNQLDAAEGVMRSVDRSSAAPARYDALTRAIAARRQGSFPFVFDRDGNVIAVYNISTADVVAINRDFEPLIDSSAGSYTIESRVHDVNDAVDTTLDAAVQRAALNALGGFRGSLVAIDPRTNEVLAAATSAGNGPATNLALEGQYEPGSVMKVLTILAAAGGGVDLAPLFPYNCTGTLSVSGRTFGDWLPGGHGLLPDIDEALAESCNIVFADVGLRTGLPRLREVHQRAGFDGQTNLGLFRLPLGHTTATPIDMYGTASYAIGLGHETISAFHLAMLASAMANRGVLTTPRIYRTRRSILGEALHDAPAQTSAPLAPPAAADVAVRAMEAVVTREKGTGHRAAVEGVPIAMKTGTAGTAAGGYDGLVMAFAPADHPKIAFALIAENSGPAEFAAAKITHDFVSALRGRF